MENLHLAHKDDTDTAARTDSEAKLDWQEQKEREAKRRKIESRYQQTEESIQQTEQRIAEIDITMCRPEYASDVTKLTELSTEKEQLEHKLEDAMELWERYAEELEQFSNI